ncbi:beta strand repeat-containing protein [Algoriphagus hitonicola]|uniref:beta strand repeat-containing protein n=1 Tax=Algoriphagus hitonicola TaxID=435880 RepID=UPI0036157A5F
MTSITVEVWGAGGRGGSRSGSNGVTGGGGGGAYSKSVLSVTAGQTISYYVGFGSKTADPGEDSWFLDNTTVMAKGGNSVGTNVLTGATGGSSASSFGDESFSGGNGGDGSGNNAGGGGSSAGINANGNNTANSTGATAPAGGGDGGDGRTGSQGRGEDGLSPGGGGGGSRRNNASGTEQVGGYGADGQIRISYIALTSYTSSDDQYVCEDDPINEITYSLPPNSTVEIIDLPPGLTSNYNSTAGTISITGIPTADGTYTINATPDYNSFITLTQSGSVTIIPKPDVTDIAETVCSGEPFTVIPVDGTNGFIPDVTTYSWDAPSMPSGLTGGAAGSGDEISGTLTNTTNSALDAIYTVTPTHNGCDGDPFEVAVTVDPVATIDDQTVEVCTGDDFSFTPTDGTDGVVPAGTTYTWESPSVTGGLTGGDADSGSSISATLNNPTNTQQTATYTVTPTSGTCVGPDFTVTVTVDPGPNIDDLTSSICSEETFTVTPENGTDGIVPAGTTYTWGSPLVTGGLTGGVAGSGSSITGTLTNPTNTSQTATYTVTPSSASCSDETFLLTVTVDPKPDVSDINETICSGGSFNLTPVDEIVPSGTTYSWSPPSISGDITGGEAGNGSTISGTLTNNTNTAQTATYTVTPISGDCTGEDFTVTVTVDPKATIDDQTVEVCTGDPFSFTPANVTDGIVPSGTTYTWEAPDLESGLTGGEADSGNIITGTLTNTSNTSKTATYTVTPISGSCTGEEFTVTVTINPGPSIDDINTSICSEGTFDITPENGTDGIVPSGTTYTWTLLSADAGISGAVDGSGNSISGTLTNSTSLSQAAVYEVTPTSGTCSDDTFLLTVTVDPKPDVSDMAETICSEGSFDLTPVDGTNGIVPAGISYSWEAPSISGELTGGEAGSGNTISGTLTNTSNIVQTATYTVTPTVDGCIGEDFVVTITVDPVPTIDDISINSCTGDPFTIEPADGIVPSGTTYDWELISVTGGITGGEDGSGGTITGTLTNPSDTPQTATYTVTPTSGSCIGPDFTVTVTVDPITEITVQPSDIGEVDCFGDGFDPISVTAVGGGLEYQWYSKTDNLDPITNPGNLISGANSASFTPPSNTPVLESYYYYVVVIGNCGEVISSLSGEYVATEPETTIIDDPSTTDLEVCKDDAFPELVVSAIGETDPDTYPEVTYQWYSNTSPSNTGGTLIDGATSSTFTPPSNTVGTLYYYAEAASLCGTVPTDVSGAHTVTPLTEIEEEDLAGQVICDGDDFDPISVEAYGTGTISYQWYQNDENSTTSGNIVAIGSDSNTFTPPSGLSNPSQSETYYYFVVVSSDCGPDITSTISGEFTVNPIPEVTNTSLNQTICSGGSSTEVALTSDVGGTTFNWTASASSGITGYTASGSGPIPAETLSNPGTTRGSVTYSITPSANGCTGPSVDYTIYVDPLPTVTNAVMSQTICSGETTEEVYLTSDVASTSFAWTATATSGVTGFTTNGTGPIPAQTITTSENSPGTVTYEITPTANTCAGPIATYTIQVNPIPTITNSELDQTICSGESSSQVDFTSLVDGTTFDWTVVSSSGASGFTSSGSGSLTSQAITATGPTQGSVTFEVTPSANDCFGPSETYTIYIDPIPTVTNTELEQTICSGGSTSEVELTSDVSDVSFDWTAVGSTGVTGFTSSGSGPIPAETITNSGTTQGTVTYTIIPSASGCSGSSTDYIVKVDPLPTPTFIEYRELKFASKAVSPTPLSQDKTITIGIYRDQKEPITRLFLEEHQVKVSR